jgi:hypothetical protein
MQHKDFDVKSKSYDVFHVEDYSWREQGYELVKRYYNEAANLLDDQFQHIMELTDNSYLLSSFHSLIFTLSHIFKFSVSNHFFLCVCVWLWMNFD